MKNWCEKTQLARLHVCCAFSMHSVSPGGGNTVKKNPTFPLPVFGQLASCPLVAVQYEEVVLVLLHFALDRSSSEEKRYWE